MIEVINTSKELSRVSDNIKKSGKNISFVPTMGALHRGHLSLISKAKKSGDAVIVSIFVNPTQFGPKEDFAKYPRNLKKDLALLKPFAPLIVFAPSAKNIYPNDFGTFVDVEDLSCKLCGEFRPGHFKGVATVVLKLFNIVKPDFAFFGKKDYQQQLLIKKMAKDLNLNIKIVTCPTIREKDGLALSSRNAYLSPVERKSASLIYKALKTAKKMAKSKNAEKIISFIKRFLAASPLIKVEYASIVKKANGAAQILIAVKIGSTRLIDNILI